MSEPKGNLPSELPDDPGESLRPQPIHGKSVQPVNQMHSTIMPPGAPSARHLVTNRQANSYTLEGLLGRGGFAKVYRARQMTLRRTIAVKVPREDLDDPS